MWGAGTWLGGSGGVVVQVGGICTAESDQSMVSADVSITLTAVAQSEPDRSANVFFVLSASSSQTVLDSEVLQ